MRGLGRSMRACTLEAVVAIDLRRPLDHLDCYGEEPLLVLAAHGKEEWGKPVMGFATKGKSRRGEESPGRPHTQSCAPPSLISIGFIRRVPAMHTALLAPTSTCPSHRPQWILVMLSLLMVRLPHQNPLLRGMQRRHGAGPHLAFLSGESPWLCMKPPPPP